MKKPLIRIGPAGWSYKDWEGVVYPHKPGPRFDPLEYLSRFFDTIEINEAFAAQVLAVTRGLGLADDAAHVNRNGGAIALGHPLGASGARLVLTAMHGLEPGRGRALVSMCVGVGQGVALALEAVR